MPEGDQDHGGVAVTVAPGLAGFGRQPLDLGEPSDTCAGELGKLQWLEACDGLLILPWFSPSLWDKLASNKHSSSFVRTIAERLSV